MKGLAKALWITCSLLTQCLAANSQVLKADFSMMEKRKDGDILVKGKITYLESTRSLQWHIAYPKAQTIAMPADSKRPSPEEEATIGLFARFLQPNGFLESGLDGDQAFKKVKDDQGANVYIPLKSANVKASLRFVDRRLTSSKIGMPDGGMVTYLFSGYKRIAHLGIVPQQITTVLDSKGKKTYKRLLLRNLAYEGKDAR